MPALGPWTNPAWPHLAAVTRVLRTLHRRDTGCAPGGTLAQRIRRGYLGEVYLFEGMSEDLVEADVIGLRLFLEFEKGDSQMALRAGFAAAGVLGVVTTFGTALWAVAVVMLVLLVASLLTLELAPRIRRR